jgi:N utilization substance protein B
MTTRDTPSLHDDAFWDGPTEEPGVATQPTAPRAADARRSSARRGVDRRAERVETRGRARALQALYAADLRNFAELRKIALQVWDDLAIDPEERRFASVLVEIIVQQHAEIDRTLGDVTANWRLERLGAVERSVLRLGAAELARGETPPRVVLQECIHLAERYGTARSARFVNGVLDAYARRLGAL